MAGTKTQIKQKAPAKAANVQAYDFKAPKKFSRENLGILDTIYTGYARLVEAHLSGVLRLNCEARLLEIGEKKYGDYAAGLTVSDVLALANLSLDGERQKTPTVVRVSNDVIMVMIDRMLGGQGLPEPESDFDGYTDLELAIVEKINGYLIPLLNDAWQNHFNVDYTCGKLKNPRLVQELGPEDMVVVVTLSLLVQDVSGTIDLCVPASSLEFLFQHMEASRRAAAKHDDKATRDAIFAGIGGSLLELSVKLDDTELMLEQLFKMQVGDVIPLDKPVDGDALLCVEGIPWFTGELGVHRQRMALKIKDFANEAR